jgi:hypothetical protein
MQRDFPIYVAAEGDGAFEKLPTRQAVCFVPRSLVTFTPESATRGLSFPLLFLPISDRGKG